MNDSEQYRAQCEAHTVAGWVTARGDPDFDRMMRYFDGVKRHRGAAAAASLTAAVRKILKAESDQTQCDRDKPRQVRRTGSSCEIPNPGGLWCERPAR